MPIHPPNSAFVRHVWPVVWRHRWPAMGALLLSGVHGYGITLQNVYLKWFLDVLEVPGMPATARWEKIAWLAAGYLGATMIIRMACWHLGYRLFTRVREKIVFALRSQFFRHVNHLCLRFHGEHPSGELFSYLFGSPLTAVMQFLQHVTMNIPGAIVTVVAVLVLFLRWDWVAGLVVVTGSLVSVLAMVRAQKRMRAISAAFQSMEGRVSGRVADLLRGTKAVKLYAMEERVEEDFVAQAELIGRKSYERDVQAHVEWMKQEAFGFICYTLLMGVSAWRYLDGHISLSIVAAGFSALVSLQPQLQVIFQAFTLWGGAAASFERIGAVLDTPSSTPDPATATETNVPAQADLRFNHVTFSYEPGRPAVRDVTLVIPSGQRIALVGPSGAGKSTIAQLLLRLYDPEEGSVQLGGIDVRQFAGTDLRRQFGVVPQDPFIFRTTLRDNLRVARPDATDVAIRQACELANAWEFIERMPGGLDAPVGEGGSTLSGGQRQRLAIARALLGNPQCFIFDEATSALDTLSETLIQEALEKNLGARTVIFIAHRLATVRNCDRILVFAEGRVVQDGTYSSLAGQPGLFQQLVAGQTLR